MAPNASDLTTPLDDPAPGDETGTAAPNDSVPGVRIGLVSGLVGIACCAGPAVLGLLGLISGATAYSLAIDLYDNWAWAFRAAGVATAGGLVWWALKKRDACSVDGVKAARRNLLVLAGVAVGTYVVLYAATTWLGTLV